MGVVATPPLNVFVMPGGIRGWRGAGLPVEGG